MSDQITKEHVDKMLSWLPEESVLKNPLGEVERLSMKVVPTLHRDIITLQSRLTAAEKERDELGYKLNEQIVDKHQLREELERANLINSRACDDWSHDDTKVKELLKPHLPGDDLESDGYGFRGVVAVAELAAARFTTLENALREANEALKQLNGLTTDAIDAKRKALQTLSDLNIK